MSDPVTVATSDKTVERDDRCAQCDSAMLYNVRDDKVMFSFCPNYYCGLWLLPVDEAARAAVGDLDEAVRKVEEGAR